MAYWVADDITARIGSPVVMVLMEQDRILSLINRAYTRKSQSVDLQNEGEGFAEEDVDDLVDNIDLSDEAPIIRWVNAIIFNAAKERASDIHIEPGEKEVVVRIASMAYCMKRNMQNKNFSIQLSPA
jgi:general secretion pathway protein E